MPIPNITSRRLGKHPKYVDWENCQWVIDVIEEVPTENWPKFKCIEKRCEPLPPHSHQQRVYLVYSRNRLE